MTLKKKKIEWVVFDLCMAINAYFFSNISKKKKIVALVKYNRLSESYVKSQKFIPKLNFLEFIVLVIKTTKSPTWNLHKRIVAIFYCGRIVSNLGNDLLFAPNFGIFTFIFRCVIFFVQLKFFFFCWIDILCKFRMKNIYQLMCIGWCAGCTTIVIQAHEI